MTDQFVSNIKQAISIKYGRRVAYEFEAYMDEQKSTTENLKSDIDDEKRDNIV